MSDDCAAEIAEHLVWLAEERGAILGALVLVPSDGFLLLANVAVHPHVRGKGLGRHLLKHAEAVAHDLGYEELRLTTHADMTETVGLYLRNGWRETEREGRRVSMRKTLLP